MEKLIDRTIDFFDNRDWNVYVINDNENRFELEIEQWSNAGEDLVFSIISKLNVRDIAKELSYLYESFDVEDHVAMWLEAKSNGVSGVPDVTTLVDDAREIEEMLYDLWKDFIKEFCIS